MKWHKYVFSTGVLLLLTAFCMLLPNVYMLYAQVDRSHATIAPVDLEVPQPADLSAAEILRVMCDAGGNVLFIEDGATPPARAEAAGVCRDILNEVFGNPTTGSAPLLKRLSGRLDAYSHVWIDTYACVALYNNQPVRFTLVAAQFEDLYMCYEQNSRVLLELSVHNQGGVTEDVGQNNEYSALLYQSTGVQAYYAGLGLQASEYDYYAYNSAKGVELYVGIQAHTGTSYEKTFP